MQIVCRHCAKQLDEAHINHELNIVTCDQCNTVFSLPSSERKIAGYNMALIPRGFTFIRDNRHIQISRKQPAHILSGCLLIIVFIFGLCSSSFLMLTDEALPLTLEQRLSSSDNLLESSFIIVEWNAIWIVPLIIITCILVFLYMNRLIISINKKGVLIVKHRPIPLPPDKQVNTGNIEQIYVTGHSVEYCVHILLQNQKTLDILRLRNAQEALFIEHEIETFLGITDYPVQGEITKG